MKTVRTNKQLYKNMEPWNTNPVTKQNMLATHPDVVEIPEAINIYTALKTSLAGSIIIHGYRHNDKTEHVLAMATSLGFKIEYYLDSLNECIEIEPYDCINPARYNHYNKDGAYLHIREAIKPHTPEMARVQAEVEFLRTRQCSRYFEVNDKVESFIRAYAPAYGIQLPRFHDLETTNDTYPPKEHTRAYEEMTGKTSKPASDNLPRAIVRWDEKVKASRRATPISEIEQTYNQIQFYLKNEIPFDDNYRRCKICGKPFRVSRFGLTDMEDDTCLDCQQDLSFCTMPDEDSFADYMVRTECGRRITTQRNILD